MGRAWTVSARLPQSTVKEALSALCLFGRTSVSRSLSVLGVYIIVVLVSETAAFGRRGWLSKPMGA